MAYDGDINDFKVEVLPEDVVARARKILECGWERGFLAQDAFGGSVSPYDASAVSFCTIGALRRATFELTGKKANRSDVYRQALRHVAAKVPDSELGDGIIESNPSSADRIMYYNDGPFRHPEEIEALLT